MLRDLRQGLGVKKVDILLHRKQRIDGRLSFEHQPAVRQAYPLNFQTKIIRILFIVIKLNINIVIGTYLSADGEERVSRSIHEYNLRLGAGVVIVDAKDEVPLVIKHSETVAIEKQRFFPNGEDHS